jgi:hypothetical protein
MVITLGLVWVEKRPQTLRDMQREHELQIFQRLVLERDALDKIIRQKAVVLFGLTELQNSQASR